MLREDAGAESPPVRREHDRNVEGASGESGEDAGRRGVRSDQIGMAFDSPRAIDGVPSFTWREAYRERVCRSLATKVVQGLARIRSEVV